MVRSKMMFVCAFGLMMTFVSSVSAGVIGWWRFNGEGTNVPNVVNPGTLDGTIVSVNNANNSNTAATDAISFGNDSSKYPTVTSNLQADAPCVYDPLDKKVYDGGKTLSYTQKFVQGGVMVPYSDALNLTAFTVQAIIRLPVGAGSRASGAGWEVFPIVQFGKDQTEGWMFGVFQGYLFSRFNYKNTSGGRSNQQIVSYYATGSGFPSLYDGKWHHVAMVFTTASANAVCRMFVDGVQYAENRTTKWKSWDYSGNLPLFIGANPWFYARTFYGDIAEVRITDDTTSVDQSNNFLVPLLDGQGLADDDTALLLNFDSASKFGFPTNATIATRQTESTSYTSGKQAYVWFAKNWNVLNAAYNAPAVPFWLTLATKGNTDHLNPDLWPRMDEATAPKGGLLEYTTGGTTNALIDSAVLTIPTESVSGYGGSNAIKLDESATYISTNSFTAECIFKTSIADNDTDTIFYTPFMKLCVYNGKLLLRGYIDSANRNSTTGDITSSAKVNDGEWHHVACVYDTTGSKSFTLYLDGSAVGFKIGKTLCYGPPTSSTDKNGFVIGAQFVSIGVDTAQGFKGSFDAVRVTRRVLSTDEFLKSSALTRLFDARFDNDTAESFGTGLPDYLAPAGSGMTMPGGAAAPAIVGSRGGKVILDGVSGTNKVAWGKALKLDGGYVLYPRNRLLERQSLTVEFFARFSDLKNSANILRFNKGQGKLGDPVWTLFNELASDGTNRLAVAARLSSDGGVTPLTQRSTKLYNLTANPDVFNQWHHWALTIEPNGDKTRFRLYRDYEPVGDVGELTGALHFPATGTCLAVGGTGVTGAYVTGKLDNIRISPGVLDPSQFMRFESPGTALSFR